MKTGVVVMMLRGDIKSKMKVKNTNFRDVMTLEVVSALSE